MFWIVNLVNRTGNPIFLMILANFLEACLEIYSLFAPVQTILPEEKIRAVVLGSRSFMITAANRFGLYSALRADIAMRRRSSRHSKSTVETTFLNAVRKSL